MVTPASTHIVRAADHSARPVESSASDDNGDGVALERRGIVNMCDKMCTLGQFTPCDLTIIMILSHLVYSHMSYSYLVRAWSYYY